MVIDTVLWHCFDSKTLFVPAVSLVKVPLIRQTDKQDHSPLTLHNPNIMDRTARIITCLSEERQ